MATNEKSEKNEIDAVIRSLDEKNSSGLSRTLDAAHEVMTAAPAAFAENIHAGVWGASKAAAAAAGRAVLPSNDAALREASAEAIAEYAHRVPAVERDLERVQKALTAHVESEARARSGALGRAVADLLSRGVLSIEDVESDSKMRDALVQAHRAALSALDPVVIPALARLATSRAGQPYDQAARAVGRILQDMSVQEYTEARAVFGLMAAAIDTDNATGRPEWARRHLFFATGLEGPLRDRRRWYKGDERRQRETRACSSYPPCPTWRGLRNALEVNGLVERDVTIVADGEGLLISESTMKLLADVFDVLRETQRTGS